MRRPVGCRVWRPVGCRGCRVWRRVMQLSGQRGVPRRRRLSAVTGASTGTRQPAWQPTGSPQRKPTAGDHRYPLQKSKDIISDFSCQTNSKMTLRSFPWHVRAHIVRKAPCRRHTQLEYGTAVGGEFERNRWKSQTRGSTEIKRCHFELFRPNKLQNDIPLVPLHVGRAVPFDLQALPA